MYILVHVDVFIDVDVHACIGFQNCNDMNKLVVFYNFYYYYYIQIIWVLHCTRCLISINLKLQELVYMGV